MNEKRQASSSAPPQNSQMAHDAIAATGKASAVTVLLTNEQTVRLDEISAAIRRRSAKSISRSAVIRALISALLPYYQNFVDCRTEAEIRQKIARTLELLTSK